MTYLRDSRGRIIGRAPLKDLTPRRMVGVQRGTLQGLTPRHAPGFYSSQQPHTEPVDSQWGEGANEPREVAVQGKGGVLDCVEHRVLGAAYRMERILRTVRDLDGEAIQAIITYLARTYWLKHSREKYNRLPHRDIAYTSEQIQRRILQSAHALWHTDK